MFLHFLAAFPWHHIPWHHYCHHHLRFRLAPVPGGIEPGGPIRPGA
jgi:hypothetical protein